MLSFSQCDIFPQLPDNSLYKNVYSISLTYTYSTVYNYTTQYTVCAFYICFLFTIWYFFTITAQFTLQQCLQHILNICIQYCLQLHDPVDWLCCLHMLYFSQCDIFSQLLHNWHYTNVCSISSTYTYGICLQLHYPVHWLCYLYMLPLHNVIFFHNYCTINSTTMSTAYPQHIHIVLFKTTLHSILALLFIYAFLFTMWYFSTMTAQLTLHQCLQHILNIYIRYLFTITLPSTLTLLFIYASFTQCDIFSQLLHNWLYNNVYSISATYTYSTFLQLLSNVYWLCCLYMLSFSQCDIFPQWLHN